MCVTRLLAYDYTAAAAPGASFTIRDHESITSFSTSSESETLRDAWTRGLSYKLALPRIVRRE